LTIGNKVLEFRQEINMVVTVEVDTMKRILMISAVIVFALTLGVAYASDMSRDMSKWDNGITIFATGPVSTGIEYLKGSVDSKSELALAPREALALDNGVSLFASSSVSTGVNYKGGEVIKGEEGMAAGGYAGEEAPLDLHNGITSFDRHPIDAD
jgi:hypothetical protein